MRLPHEPVLRDEALQLWVTPTARRIVDGTAGRAGHSLAILGERHDVRLLAIDRDPEAVDAVSRRFAGFDGRASVVQGSYADLPTHLAAWGESAADGILLDLGVSSPQLDDPARGFSHRTDAPLDLRFDPRSGMSAAEWIAEADLEEIERVLRELGEEPRPRAVARAIVAARAESPIDTTARLRRHRELGHTVILASASLEPYVGPLAELLGVHGVVCTRLEHDGDGRLTGRLRGANCRGPEKARRVEEWLRQAGFTGAELWCYGDSASDDEFLAAADHPVRVDGVRIGPEPG